MSGRVDGPDPGTSLERLKGREPGFCRERESRLVYQREQHPFGRTLARSFPSVDSLSGTVSERRSVLLPLREAGVPGSIVVDRRAGWLGRRKLCSRSIPPSRSQAPSLRRGGLSSQSPFMEERKEGNREGRKEQQRRGTSSILGWRERARRRLLAGTKRRENAKAERKGGTLRLALRAAEMVSSGKGKWNDVDRE